MITPSNTQAVVAPPAGPSGPDINSIMGGWVDRGPWKYWDTWTNALASPAVAVPNSIDLFSTPIGQVDPYTNLRKTKLQTNMQRGNQFPPPKCLVLQQIGIYILSTDVKAAIDQFLNLCYLEFRIDDKIFYEGFPWMFPAGAGLMGSQNQGGTDQWFTNGFPAPQATWRAGSFAKYIAPQQQFSWKFIFDGPAAPPTMATAFTVVGFLDGLTDRSVQ